MVKEFESGKSYEHISGSQKMMVLAVAEVVADGVWLAILKVDPDTNETSAPDEAFVLTTDFAQWQEMVI